MTSLDRSHYPGSCSGTPVSNGPAVRIESGPSSGTVRGQRAAAKQRLMTSALAWARRASGRLPDHHRARSLGSLWMRHF
jgi:hypothetical protein